ncbi:siphovirus Gp157 family protein [Dehalobacter sp.]|uniref:siphovirus Gp157 family protein n=1 Tax=Dehalobacter sp. TaxID=1962289 RepID=UPI0025878CD5|nr:siphovirus Gp157 family protein [Dehalobacter sp.]MDJ0305369.1 siphovirus Gp157 family protein [Dehalobacter sp.]
MPKLYELTNDFNTVFNFLEQENVGTEVLETLEKYLQGIETDVETKIENITKMILTFQAQAEAYKAESDRLSNNAKSMDNKIHGLKEYVLTNMQQLGKDKIQTTVGSVRRQRSPLSVQILSQNSVPDKYKYTPDPVEQVDRRAILKDFTENGEVIPGVEFVQNYHMRIY